MRLPNPFFPNISTPATSKHFDDRYACVSHPSVQQFWRVFLALAGEQNVVVTLRYSPPTFVLLFFLSTTPRTQLNYYGFIHVRSFSTTGSTTTALWVNRDLASSPGSDDIDAVLTLRRVEPCESAKTVDGRRSRKEQALHTVEEDLGVSAKSLQMDQIRHLAWQHVRGDNDNDSDQNGSTTGGPSLWSIMVCVPSDPPALNLALRPPPPLALLPSPILPVEVKTKTTATKSPNRDDDQASAANLLLLLSKAS